MHAKLEKVLIKFAYIGRKDYFCTRFKDQWFRSSVGLEQQPSKLWVLGSNPNEITKTAEIPTEFLPFSFYLSQYFAFYLSI